MENGELRMENEAMRKYFLNGEWSDAKVLQPRCADALSPTNY
jgi:hypothetical protein